MPKARSKNYRPEDNYRYAVAAGMKSPQVFDFAAEGKRCIVRREPAFFPGPPEYDGDHLLGAGDVCFEPTRCESAALLMLRRTFSTVHICWVESCDSWSVCCDFGKIVPFQACRFTGLSEYTICDAACRCMEMLLKSREMPCV